MRFVQLQYLEAAIRTGSFRQAAAELRVAQPTISTQVQRLEEELGVVLLLRGVQGVRPTFAAEQILPHLMAALQAEHSMRQEASALDGLQGGRVRLAAVSAASQSLLPRVVRRLQSEHPNIQFSVSDLGSDEVRRGVIDGKYDAGILIRLKGKEEGGLRHVDVAEGRLVLAVPEDHPLAKKSKVTGADLAGQSAVIFTPPSLLRHAFEELTRNVAVNPVCYTDSAETAQRMVRAGVGVAIAHTLAVSTRSGEGAVLIPLRGKLAVTRMSVVLRPDEHLSPAVRTFLNIIKGDRVTP